MVGEGAAPEIGAAVEPAVAAEGGGLGAAVKPIGGEEGLGREIAPEMRTSEIGSVGIGGVSPETGLAAKLDATLNTPGAGIEAVAEVNIPEGTQTFEHPPLDLKTASVEAPPGVTTQVKIEMPTEAAEPEAVSVSPDTDVGGKPPVDERQTQEVNKPQGREVQTEQSPKEVGGESRIPGRVANDPEFRAIYGNLFAQELQAGTDASEIDVKITEQAVSEYYDNGAKSQVEKGLPDKIKKDPLYQQKLGEAMTSAQDKGEPLDANKLSQEALSKYQQEKDLQAEKAEPQVEGIKTVEQRLQDLERVDRLDDRIAFSKEDLQTIKAIVEAAQTKEQNSKKKEGLFKLLLKIAALIAVASVAQVGKQVEQDASRQKR